MNLNSRLLFFSSQQDNKVETQKMRDAVKFMVGVGVVYGLMFGAMALAGG